LKQDTMAPINYNIKSRRVILIDSEGKKQGEFVRDDAIKLAREENLDLVMVGNGEVPVCKIMDYGKFLYQQKKKASASSASKLKEVQLSPVISDHDLEIKTEHARDFLEKGHKVKVVMKFKGRQRFHRDQGFEKFQKMLLALSDIAQQDGEFQSAGAFLFMNLSKK
jgi:translation initiation factor IF-3